MHFWSSFSPSFTAFSLGTERAQAFSRISVFFFRLRRSVWSVFMFIRRGEEEKVTAYKSDNTEVMQHLLDVEVFTDLEKVPYLDNCFLNVTGIYRVNPRLF